MFNKFKKMFRKRDRSNQQISEIPDQTPQQPPPTYFLPPIYEELLDVESSPGANPGPVPDQRSDAVRQGLLGNWHYPLPDVPSSSPESENDYDIHSGYLRASRLGELRDSIAEAEGPQLRSFLLELVDGLERNILLPAREGLGLSYEFLSILMQDDASSAVTAPDSATAMDSQQSSTFADFHMRTASPTIPRTEDSTVEHLDHTRSPNQLSSTHNDVETDADQYFTSTPSPATTLPPAEPTAAAAATTQVSPQSAPSVHGSGRAATPQSVSEDITSPAQHSRFTRNPRRLSSPPTTDTESCDNVSTHSIDGYSTESSSVCARRRTEKEMSSSSSSSSIDTISFRECKFRSRSNRYVKYKVTNVYNINNHSGSVVFPAAPQGIQCGSKNRMKINDYENYRPPVARDARHSRYEVVVDNRAS